MGKKLDWSGKIQGDLTIVRDVGKDSYGSRLWECICKCGATVNKTSGNLANGVKSCSTACGVATSNIVRTKHGQARDTHRSKVYNAWLGLKDRCLNPKAAAYHRYGGRGITVCDSWRDSYDAFYKDVGEPPTPKHTLDRIDNNKGYEPSNVRWATRKEQSNNISTNVWVEYDGKRMTWAQWAEYLGISYNCLMTRKKKGKPIEEILLPPLSAGRPKGVKDTKPRNN